ncbi:hypothetical protein LRR18_18355, partial [Mangrovimonas sp. AS39]|uniref:ATP-dependent DNA ligase n=1 Tax=Mangrovimonas futianensis TaxID=2895523 RepID=UPI001E44E383
EARSLWQKKLDRKYSETPEDAQVESYGPMLAKDFNPKKVKYPAYVQPKMDGVRALASWDGDRVILMSRGNKEWTVPKHINKALEAILPKDSMFD